MIINKAQEIALEIISMSPHNELDGMVVAQSLRSNRNLWKAVWMTSLDSLIILRDLSQGIFNHDTIFILPAKGCEATLYKLVQTRHADEIDWMKGEEACSLLGLFSDALRKNDRQLLRLWWD